MTDYREILRLYACGISQRSIANSCQCSRNTVSEVISRAKKKGICWSSDSKESDLELQQKLFPEKTLSSPKRKYPDYDYIDQEMKRSGVTLKLLWTEYCEECRMGKELPLMYSQFCYYYQKYSEKKRGTMHIPRKPGEQIEVDWAGKPAYIIDRDTGELIPCYIFVGVLNYSLYAYAEAFLSMNMESWITAHVNMFKYFGGSTKMLIPDNLKTGVERTDWYTPQINRTYHEMSEHYNTAVIPARVSSPKDKPAVEATVGVVSKWITAAIRNEKFFTVEELNKEIDCRLKAFNHNPFQKKEGCRYSVYLEEKPFLQKLPSNPYELAYWKQATVQFNYHISVDKMNYSVPCEYIRQKVEVRLTKSIVEVFYKNMRICSHKRLYGHKGQYSTVEAHMPENHQKYLKWDGTSFIEWAKNIGPSTTITVKSILASYKVEQQGYKACMGLLKLGDKYSVSRLEAACEKALYYTPHPSYKSIKNILTTGQDKVPVEEAIKSEEDIEAFGYTRGAGYYGGKKNDK